LVAKSKRVRTPNGEKAPKTIASALTADLQFYPTMSALTTAHATLNSRLARNPYPGRGLVLGKSANGDAWQQVYWIMGRSPNSRNRQFALKGSTLRTEPYDPAKVEDPSLIIYEAMLELPGKYLVSNGDQTRTLCDGLKAGLSMREALALREREPDAPNYTPRITGMLDLAGETPEVALSIIKPCKIDPAGKAWTRTTESP